MKCGWAFTVTGLVLVEADSVVYCMWHAGHPTCLDLTQEMIPIIKSYQWQCMECKSCVKCMNPHDEVCNLSLPLPLILILLLLIIIIPIEWRIRFKLATLTYKALQTGRPPYLADLIQFIQFHSTPKSTRSSSTQLLFVSHHNLSFGSRAFHVSTPKVWNILPFHIRQSQSLSTSDVI